MRSLDSTTAIDRGWLPAKLRSVIKAQAKGFAALKLLCRLARIVRTAGPFKVHFARTNALNGRKMSDVRPLFQALPGLVT